MALRSWLLQWFGPGILGGLTAGDWWRLLCDHRFGISPRFIPRALCITAHAIPNSALRRWEDWRFGREVSQVEIFPPIFLLGHWRNGTTLLHNLLATDERFASPNTFQSLFPHSFLTTERVGSVVIDLFLPKNRPMDNVEMRSKTPQEDEFALAVLSQHSPLLGWVFHRERDKYDRFLTFAGASADQVARWRESLLGLLRKLTWKYHRPLLLKSPPHTARVPLLLEMFPDAKFIHIHRDPFSVFQSSRRMFDVNFAFDGLQHCPGDSRDEWILRQYRAMYDAYFRDRENIPDGQLCEVAFELLEADPLRELRRVYAELGLPDFAVVEPAVQHYVNGIADYKKNKFTQLPEELRRRIADAWDPCFEEWGYSREIEVEKRPHETVG